jgi:flagellar hook-associated protein 3 FlgL
MRIATSTILEIGINGMTNTQSQLVQLTSEIATNRTVLYAGDNPDAAAQSVAVSTASAMETQYSTNASTATSALGTEDKTLSTVNSTIGSILSDAEEANSGGTSDADRQSYATEIQGLRATLLSLANTTDATGNYIFGGYQNASPPFTNNANGIGATYNGDQGVSTVAISGQRNVALNDPGSNVFMSSVPGATSPIPVGASSNTGSGTIGGVATTQSGAPSNADPYQVVFQVDANGNTTYTVQDMTPVGTPPAPAAPSAPQAYTAGTPIQLGSGETLTINGAPANGDSFSVAPPTAAQNNVFTTIDNLITALQTPVSGPAAQTNLTNELATLQIQLGNTQTNVQTINASVGARETEVNAMSTVSSTTGEADSAQLSNLVGLTSTASATVYSELSSVNTQLEATQKAFVSVQGLSLFSLIQT